MDLAEPAGSGKTVKKKSHSLFEIRKNCTNLLLSIRLHLTIQPRGNSTVLYFSPVCRQAGLKFKSHGSGRHLTAFRSVQCLERKSSPVSRSDLQRRSKTQANSRPATLQRSSTRCRTSPQPISHSTDQHSRP